MPRWTQCNHKGPLKTEERPKRGRRKWDGENRGQSDGIDGQLGATRRGVQEPSENWVGIPWQSSG